ncbi:protein ALTERED PHOSPHATE STARVATION RESPONSE 1 isoform X1 [Coffea arabica]|uniref:Nitrate regulatory gene2 protein-like n=1 Tax=Coffea arabica TaxID=13443 RepID=A0A6P6UEK4_COFAR|nr:nitrate regulatory gene2 protein-like [Coffea arabica]XP_027088333.1 nitrate regulatory gene2 protein-like [Coffea arabica]XP_027088334.1 nitrate regulatory gene2 protein-like [Coffea arabica]
MGCVASSIDKEERVRICKERKRILKRLLVLRKQYADSQLEYLRALRNTGVTLRQFTESESLEIEDGALGHALPPSPPPPLPPSPPPPPSFSPDLRNCHNNHHMKTSEEEIIDIDEDNSHTPPPPVLSTSWEYWDPFGSTSPNCQQKSKIEEEQVEEENWAEANTEFEEEDQVDVVAVNNTVDITPVKKQTASVVDENSSVMSWHTKDTADLSMVIWGRKKTLSGIIRDIDDYFVKASAGGKDVAVFLDFNVADSPLYQSINENKRKRSNSAKVFNALTWSWSSKSLQSTRDAGDTCGPSDPCKPGAHCVTLAKLYDAERKLHREVKEEELTKLEHERKSLMLQKLEEEDHDWSKTDKARSVVESLQSDILSLQQSNSSTCSTILNLIDEELHPQLIVLISGLMCMWRRMYECHQVQNHIAQQLNHLVNQQNMEPTSEYDRQAAAQLKTEVNSWYNSLCRLVKSQREYVSALCRWVQLTNCLVDNGQGSVSSSAVCTLSKQWLVALDKLPDKRALEAINSLLSAVRSIVLQQEEEVNLYKRSDKLERRLERELNLLSEMEMKFEGSFTNEEMQTVLGPKHPLSVKRAKIEVLKKRVDDEKSKYINSIQNTRAMILNNLQTSLPNVFQALMAFSNSYTESFDTVLSYGRRAENDEAFPNPAC